MEKIKQKSLSVENILYIIILVVGISIIVINRIIRGFNDILWISDIASIIGTIYIILVAKHIKWSLILSLISTSIIAFTNYYQGIWFNFALNVCVNIPVAIYGFVTWNKNEKNDFNKTLNVLSKKARILVWGGYALAVPIFMTILYLIKSNLFYIDAIYNAGCFIGAFLCSKTYIDQFPIFIFANLSGITMYVILCTTNINNLPLLLLNIIYTIVNIIGYFNWKKLIKNLKTENNDQIIENNS